MQIETWFKVEYKDCIGDNFEDDVSKEDMKDLIEQHLQDYCEEHKIERSCVKILR